MLGTFGIVLLALYFVPSVLAWSRGHDSKIAITALNVLLGWSVLGWVAAFVWALTTPKPVQTIVIAQPERI